MTKEYEPIKITESTPEPKEDGIYLITSSVTGKALGAVLHVSDLPYPWVAFGIDDCWGMEQSWEDTRFEHGGLLIQSLAAHDAQIRAEALELSDEEQHLVIDVFNTDPYLEHLAGGNAIQDYDERQAYLIQLFNKTLLSVFPIIVEHRKKEES